MTNCKTQAIMSVIKVIFEFIIEKFKLFERNIDEEKAI